VKVLITGAGGQVGRSLLACAPAHATITAYTHARLDIGDPGAVEQAVRDCAPDVIINAAAYTAVDRAESEPGLAHRINAEGPRHLAVAARGLGARLVHLSTDFVFDGGASVPYGPDAATRPLNVYGTTKRAGERSVLELLPNGALILRTAWVYAAEGRNFLRTMLAVLRGSGSARVVADQVGTPTSAISLADTLWKLTDVPALGGIHHWTDAGVASWYDFAVAIAEEGVARGLLPEGVSVVPITTAEYRTPARRPAFSVLDKQTLIARGLVPMHWRKRLRMVLAEISHV